MIGWYGRMDLVEGKAVMDGGEVWLELRVGVFHITCEGGHHIIYIYIYPWVETSLTNFLIHLVERRYIDEDPSSMNYHLIHESNATSMNNSSYIS